MNIQANGSDQGELIAQLAALRAENVRLKAQATAKLHLKVSEKGAVAVYGMGKWPVTLYRGQMERLLEAKEVILAFITDHAAELSVKS